MPTILSHAFVAAVAGHAIHGSTPPTHPPARFWLLGMLCAILPDADVIAFSLGVPPLHMLAHRGLTHSLPFALCVGWMLGWFAFRAPRWDAVRNRYCLYLCVAMASHGILDAFTAGGSGIAFFAPFSAERYASAWRPIAVSPIGIARFLTARGVAVLKNEMVWLWIPGAALAAAIAVARRRTLAIVATAIATIGLSAADQARASRTHRLEATPSTVAYGYYWSEAKPALRVASGDIIDVDTLLTSTPTRLEQAGVASGKIQSSLKAIVTEVAGDRRGPGGHILTGPVFVEGAEPGDVLEVKILSIDLALDYGYNGCSGFLPENCDKSVPMKIVPLDRKSMTAEFLPRIVVPLQPFFGSMGVAPEPAMGRVSSNPPGRHAGNLDNRELVAGSTLYIPVFVPGALFEIGDGHAAQGDGEVDQTAIETSLRGRVQLAVRKGERLVWPRAETPSDYISMAADPDLFTATRLAVQEMIDFLAAHKHLTRHQAYQLVSVAGHVAVTQLVDRPVVGVHVRMPKSIFK